jgi:hypothetical protein
MSQENHAQGLEERETGVGLVPSAGERRTAAASRALSPGRREQRQRQTRNVVTGDSEWPGQVPEWRLEHQGRGQKTGKRRAAVGVGGPRLAPERADAARLLALGRGQWPSEPPFQGGRAVSLEAERSQGRWGNLPQGMAALRTTGIGLRRWAGSTNLAAACRRCAAQPTAALHLSGMALENCIALLYLHGLFCLAAVCVILAQVGMRTD